MKKVCLVVQDKQQHYALTKLREVGVMHIEVTKTASEGFTHILERKAQIENAINLIMPFKVSDKKPAGLQKKADQDRRMDTGPRRGRRTSDKMGIEEIEPYSVDAVNAPERPDLSKLLNSFGNERKELEEKLVYLTREYGRIEPWGEFNPNDAAELAEKGVRFFFYELTPDIFSAIPEDTRYVTVSKGKNTVRLMVFDNEIPNIAPFRLPEQSLSRIGTELCTLKEQIDSLNEKIKNFANRRSVLEREMADINREINFETVRSELDKIDDIPAEFDISRISGFVPADDIGKLKAAAAEHQWAFVADDPKQDDIVPTKLKNNKLVNLLNPITGFLGILPGYNEVDISAWFLLFFCIFFAMIFGDAAYGIIFTLIALLGIIKTAKKGVPQALQLLLLLGVFNAAWGVLTCSWFGVDIEKVPQFLQRLSLSYISEAKTDELIVAQNLQIFCFSLALIHLSIARIKSFFINIRSLRALADLGNIGMLAGMYNVVLFLVVSNDTRVIPLLQVSIYLLAGGFFLSFVFASYEGSIGRSILSSFKNIISVVLGITNIFSDIMSYIRLWAVGLAGASIASTINTMAGPMLGNFLIFAGVILLIFGHGLNIILNVLSVVVHGVRLNTLEFSGHVGLTWSGTPYQPFADKR
ncbi:MAG: V-type ATP synthase subunit I [Treponema sp.]|nr:V-type ATP synthase subunit I [Treponema sp.]